MSFNPSAITTQSVSSQTQPIQLSGNIQLPTQLQQQIQPIPQVSLATQQSQQTSGFSGNIQLPTQQIQPIPQVSLPTQQSQQPQLQPIQQQTSGFSGNIQLPTQPIQPIPQVSLSTQQPQQSQPQISETSGNQIFVNADQFKSVSSSTASTASTSFINAQFSQFSQASQIPSSPSQLSHLTATPNTSKQRSKGNFRSSTYASRNSTRSLPAERIPVTATFDANSDIYSQFANVIAESQKTCPYSNESLISPYEDECPLAKYLLCQPSVPTNLLRFDSTLLSVKLTDFKDEAKRIYQVSLLDLRKYYSINTKAMAAFKTHYTITPQEILNKNALTWNALATEYNNLNKIATSPNTPPGDKTNCESRMKKIKEKLDYIQEENKKLTDKLNTQKEKAISQNQSAQDKSIPITYNTAVYPITDKGGKWLTISYLVPYLMFASPIFMNHTSNLLNNLLIASSYNPFGYTTKIINNTQVQVPNSSSDYMQALLDSKYIKTSYADPKFKLIPKVDAESSETSENTSANENPNSEGLGTNTNNTNGSSLPAKPKVEIHKLILQIPKPIIPNLLDPTSDATHYNASIPQDIRTAINTNQIALSTLQAFYKSRAFTKFNKMLNPADLLCVAAFNRLKTLQPQISIVKIDASKLDTNGNIIDTEIIKKLKGIKEKKVKEINEQGQTNEITYESQPMYDYKEATIEPKATLQNLHKYAIATNQITMTDEDLKKIKTKVEGDENKFNFLLQLTQQVTQTQTQNPVTGAITQVQNSSFLTWLATQGPQRKTGNGTGAKGRGRSKATSATSSSNALDLRFINDASENVTAGDYSENGDYGNFETVESVESVEGVPMEMAEVEAINPEL